MTRRLLTYAAFVAAAAIPLAPAAGAIDDNPTAVTASFRRPPPPPCPEGWKRKGKVAGNGTFTCVATNRRMPAPATPIDCPDGTSFFAAGGRAGCERTR